MKCSGLKWQIPFLHTTYCPKLLLIWATKDHHTVWWDNEKTTKIWRTLLNDYYIRVLKWPLSLLFHFTKAHHKWHCTKWMSQNIYKYFSIVVHWGDFRYLSINVFYFKEHKQLSVVEDICNSRTQEAGIWGIKIWDESAWLIHTLRVCFKSNK